MPNYHRYYQTQNPITAPKTQLGLYSHNKMENYTLIQHFKNIAVPVIPLAKKTQQNLQFSFTELQQEQPNILTTVYLTTRHKHSH